ncbi:glycosyltransferase [Proteus terrae]|uniref:glycosyltransferase n=1 Tax=Proteus terrae TaxID=1574161 RepID=UPI0022477B8F|nr:glycosyltransferase [Proteus terrae]MCW9690191.1 glycosyltransferase [Proteus terrae]MDR9743600.1 glycosyltransferase [Proteus terrae]
MKMKNKTIYDYIFITNLPSFYKINLYNEISKIKKIKVIFISDNSEIRNSNFMRGKLLFEYEIITKKSYEKRSKLSIFYSLLKIIFSNKFKLIVFSGWESIETNLIMFFISKNKNAIQIESSINESKTNGIKGLIKKLILKRCSLAFPSGELQYDILKALNFKGKIKMTHGVGLLDNSFFSKKINKIKDNKIKRFIYIGRLSKEKNIEYLIHAFNKNNLPLTIIGEGPEKTSLKSIAYKNINFLGYINNQDLKEILLEHDIFILPSLSEPWGLVIEEAIYSHLPVLVSENVGCKSDLVNNLKSGLVFPLDDIEKLNDIINLMLKNYEYYLTNIKNLNYTDRIFLQVNAYI